MTDIDLLPDESREQAVAYAELILGPAGINAGPGDLISRRVLAGASAGAEHPFVEVLHEVAASLDVNLISGVSDRGNIGLKAPELGPMGVDAGPESFEQGWRDPRTIAPLPTAQWIDEYFGGKAGDAWDALYGAMRLGEGGAASWNDRFTFLDQVATNLRELELEALHFESGDGGTSLTVPLARSSKWTSPRAFSRDGEPFTPNLPCEEVFATPDWTRVEGTATTTRPMRWEGGAAQAGEVTFVFVPGQEGHVETSDLDLEDHLLGIKGQLRLGEVALVDADSAARRTGRPTFGDTLLDENSYSHLAIGPALPMAYGPGTEGVSQSDSALHMDFVVGADDLVVTGRTESGEELEILVAGEWGERVAPR